MGGLRTERRADTPGPRRTLQRRCLNHANFATGEALAQALQDFIATYNRLEAHVYRWTYTGDALAA